MVHLAIYYNSCGVPNDLEFEEAHEMIDRIEQDVLEKMGIFLVIHMDPVEMNDMKVIEKRNLVTDVIKKLDERSSVHDFRVVKGEYQINLIFDLVIPFSYTHGGTKVIIKDCVREEEA